jgi:hypothetical protein
MADLQPPYNGKSASEVSGIRENVLKESKKVVFPQPSDRAAVSDSLQPSTFQFGKSRAPE